MMSKVQLILWLTNYSQYTALYRTNALDSALLLTKKIINSYSQTSVCILEKLTRLLVNELRIDRTV